VSIGCVAGIAVPIQASEANRFPNSPNSLIAQSNQAMATLKQGQELYNLTQYEQALAAFDKAIELDPDLVDAWYWKGRTLHNLEQYDKALQAYANARRLAPKDPKIWKSRGDAMSSLAFKISDPTEAFERFSFAIEFYDEALNLLPKDSLGDRATTLMERGDSLFAQGSLLSKQMKDSTNPKYREAESSYTEVIKLAKLNNDENQQANALWRKGEALRKQNQYPKALQAFRETVKLKQDFAEGWFRLGRVQIEKQPDEARIAFQKALDLAPSYTEAWHNQGILLENLKQYEKAAKSFSQAILGTSFNQWLVDDAITKADSWYGRGLALYHLGCFSQSIYSLNQAKELKEARDLLKEILTSKKHTPSSCRRWD